MPPCRLWINQPAERLYDGLDACLSPPNTTPDQIKPNEWSRFSLASIDALHNIEEPIEAHRLGNEILRMEPILPQDIRVRRRASQDNDRNALQCRALLDLLQNLPPILLGQVHIEQDQMRARNTGVLSLASEKSHCLYPVRCDVQVDMHLGVLKRFPRQQDIVSPVFNQENFDTRGVRSNRFHCFPSHSGFL